MRLHPNTSVCFSRLLGFLAVALVFFAGLAAHASTVGTFNISGNVTITGSSFSTVDWASNQATASGGTGIYSGLSGNVTLANLTNPPDTVGGSGFADQLFLSFASSLSNLNVNFIPSGAYGTSQCGLTASVGQVCTFAGSPISWANTPSGAGIGSTASWMFSGVTADGLDTWTATFTSQFNAPFQTEAAMSSLTNSYSATFTVDSVPVTATPEPSSLMLLGSGLAGLAGLVTRKRRR